MVSAAVVAHASHCRAGLRIQHSANAVGVLSSRGLASILHKPVMVIGPDVAATQAAFLHLIVAVN
jgi:hypothetical protein